ncbi:MAG TPA: HemK/PrmC family methyltransferase [Bdellovibrionota bacterium]|jgi:release factor glutamine methyltransferase|nr:HemK/PrmC family methyltransferase [Bdellovibrionota bacterium]
MSPRADELRAKFRELGIEHEFVWAWDFAIQSRADLFASEVLLGQILERRAQGEPLAYIMGEWPFLGVSLAVAPGVLIPRPETEELAEKMSRLVLASAELSQKTELTLLDLGAGSGALGIGVATELLKALPRTKVSLISVERSADAVPTLRRNLESLQKNHPLRWRTELRHLSWNDLDLSCLEADLVLGNPPYISDEEWGVDVDKSVKSFEPRAALTPEAPTARQKSLAHDLSLSESELELAALGPLLENLDIARRVLTPRGLVGIEIGPSQAALFESKMRKNLERHFELKLGLVEDLSAKPRFLIGCKNG